MKQKQDIIKPTDLSEFKIWLKSDFGHELDDKYQYYYDTVVKKLKTDFEESKYWLKLLKELSRR